MNNTNIEYSKEALEVKAFFYRKKISVFVEGDDDVIFWESLFNIAGYDDIHIEDVGGYLELIPYMKKITEENTKILVAADTDHRDVIGFDFEDDKILRTFGYSIENSMYSVQRVQRVIKKLSFNKSPKIEELRKWRINFSNEAKKLLVYSIANCIFEKGEVIFGDKCSRFTKKNVPHELCPNKITNFIAQIPTTFSREELETAEELLNQTTKDTWFLIKGHFLTNGILNHITHSVIELTGKKPHISLKVLYALCVDNEELKDKNSIDIRNSIDNINRAMAKVKEN